MTTTPFPPLSIPYNDQGWGPAPNSLPPAFATLPFAAFGRGEKVGKAADFGNFLTMRQRGMFRRGVDENVDLSGALYEAGDSEFIMVDTAKAPRRGGYNAGGGGGGGGGGRGGGGGQRGGGGGSRGGFRGGRGGVNQGARGWEDRQSERKGSDGSSFNKRYNKLTQARWVQSSNRMGHKLLRDPSVRVASDWLQLELLDFTHLVKMAAAPSLAKDLKWFGQLDAYDEEFDRSSAKKATKLRNFANKSVKSVGSKNDTVFEELAGNGIGNVFATESVLSHLMACGRSFYPWDIVITYAGGTIFLDAREPQDFDLLSVNENSHVIPSEEDPEDINGRRRLALEATLINQDFSQQVLLPNSKPDVRAEPIVGSSAVPSKMDPIPFFDSADREAGEEAASGALRYRCWGLGKDTTIVVRSTVNAIIHKRQTEVKSSAADASVPRGSADERRLAKAAAEAAAAGAPSSTSLVKIFTLNEWDPKSQGAPADWRKSIDNQRGNVLATEMKNNSFKLAKATAQALLSGCDVMKIGFVSRVARTDPESHVIIGTHSLAPKTFAHQMSLDENNMWGIVKWLIDQVRKHAVNLQAADSAGDGSGLEDYVAKFVLLRDPNFPRLQLYNIPLEAFEGDEARRDEDEEGWQEPVIGSAESDE